MSEQARQNFLAYAEKHDSSKLAENVVFTIMATGQEFHGREQVGQMLDFFYHVAFNADAEIKNLIFAEKNVVLEADVVGEQLMEYAGIQPRPGQVRVPLCVVYDLENDLVVRARIYFESDALRVS
jgi:hypothetical protein